MRTATGLTLLGLVVMTVTIMYGFRSGGGWAEVGDIVALPWGLATMIDIYVGFALFCGWVWYREPSRTASVLWTLGVLSLGNWLTCLYVLIALGRSRGDWRRFWLGMRQRAKSGVNEVRVGEVVHGN